MNSYKFQFGLEEAWGIFCGVSTKYGYVLQLAIHAVLNYSNQWDKICAYICHSNFNDFWLNWYNWLSS